MDVVDRAGGPKDAKKDLARVYVTKVSGQELRFSLKDFKDKGDTSQNPMMDPGTACRWGSCPARSRCSTRCPGLSPSQDPLTSTKPKNLGIRRHQRSRAVD